MHSVTGKMVIVNAKTGENEVRNIPEKLYREFLGGYGLGVALLMEHMDPAADPLGPGNILGFASGYLTGTGAYIASRFMVFGISPSTKGWGDSNCGAHFGRKMKQAGFDVILLTGLSEKPVYLLIDQGKVEFLDASFLWGKDTYQTEDLLIEKHGKECSVVCIGPAGERMAAIAGISTEKGRFAARSALGAVMGAKKVKAIVVKGNIPITLGDPERMKALRKKHLPAFKEGFAKELGKFGTPLFYQDGIELGDTPFKNWSSSIDEWQSKGNNEAERLLGYQKKRYACDGCPIACGGHVKIDKGPFKTETDVHKVEYETMGVFGANLLNQDLEALIKINDICNRYGIDTISTGGLCSYAFECYQNGYITKKDTGGLELSWGNAAAIVALVEKIAKADGIGAVLSKGFEEAVKVFGPETAEFAMAVRNEGLPAHDPRWSKDLALTYYFDATPARHTQGCTTFPVAGYEMAEGEEAAVQAKAHHDNVNWYHVLSSSGLCIFGFSVLDYKTLPDFLEAADGSKWTMAELEKIGHRIAVLRHIFNLKAGINPKDFKFPARVLGNPPLQSGETRGVSIDLEAMLKAYLKEAGFDTETAIPGKEVLAELGLSKYF